MKAQRRPTYDPNPGLVPVPDNAFNNHTARKRYDRKGTGIPKVFDIRKLVQPSAVAAIRKAFMESNVSRDDWASVQRHGRLDGRAGHRVAQGHRDVFRNRNAQSVTRVRCIVLIDSSGSMHGTMMMPNPSPEIVAAMRDYERPHYENIRVSRAHAAAIFGATVAQALGKVPSVNIEVWQHAASRGAISLKWRWAKGTPIQVFQQNVRWGGGGNADGHALMAIADRAKRTRQPGEKIVVLVVSDGLPSIYAPDGTGNAGDALVDAVTTLRDDDVTVLGVAIDGSDQTVYYGKGFVPFTGNWTALGKGLAKEIGASLAGRTGKRRVV